MNELQKINTPDNPIMPILIGTETAIKEKCLYTPFLNMAIAYRSKIPGTAEYQFIMESSGNSIDKKALHALAMSNLAEYPVKPMFLQIFRAFITLTTKEKRFGATLLLNPDIRRQIKDEVSNVKERVFIIPSSIHEVLLLNDTEYDDSDITKLNEMIVEVNHSDNLLPNEILSDKTYVYNIQTDELKIAS